VDEEMGVKRRIIKKEKRAGYEWEFEPWPDGIIIDHRKWRTLRYYDMKESDSRFVSNRKQVDYAVHNYSPHNAHGRMGKETRDNLLHGTILVWLCPFCLKMELNGEFTLYVMEVVVYQTPPEGQKGQRIPQSRYYYVREGRGVMKCKMCGYKIEWEESPD
jgi:hypothetical protein